MSDDIVDLYLATGDFHEAVKQSGLPTHIAHLKLIKSGYLTIQDKIQYGLTKCQIRWTSRRIISKVRA